MSDGARLALGAADNLVDAIPRGPSAAARGAVQLFSAVYFFRVLERGDRVLIGMQFTEPVEGGAWQEADALLLLQGNFLQHYFHLLSAERGLYSRTKKRPPGGARLALQQLERERQRIARELHTGVGQMLAAIRMHLETVGDQLPDPPPVLKQALDNISRLAGDALQQVRSVSRLMYTPEWQALTLETALRQLWEVSGIPQRFRTSLNFQPLPHEPDLDVKVLIYRAAQEALSNLTQHSRATRVDLILALVGPSLVLTIQDDGVGFDAQHQLTAPASVGSGIGLRSIREQAAALGGTSSIESSPSGTRLVVSVPFEGQQELPV